MSFCQELLFLSNLTLPRFNPMIAEVVEIRGTILPNAVCDAIDLTILHHEALRSRYATRRLAPTVEVLDHPRHRSTVITLLDEPRVDHLADAIRRQISSVNSSTGNVIAGVLARNANDAWIWMLAIHHLSSDGWSQYLYGRTFSAALSGAGGLLASSSSIDYARRQKTWFDSDAADDQLRWCVGLLSALDAQPLPLPAHDLNSDQHLVSMRIEMRIRKGIHDAVLRIARKAKVPILAVMFASFAKVVAKKTSTRRVSALSVVSGRTLKGSDTAGGAFYNSIVITADLANVGDDAELLLACASSIFDAWKRQEVPLGLVAQACVNRGFVDPTSKFPITFNLVRHPLAEFRIPGCEVRAIDRETLGPLTLSADEPHVTHRGPLDFLSAATVTVCDLADEFHVLLDVSARPSSETEAVELLKKYEEELEMFVRGLDDGLAAATSPAPTGLISSGVIR